MLICLVSFLNTSKLGQLDYSPENLDHLPTNRKNFIAYARDAIAKSSAPTLTTDVSLKHITQDGINFIMSDVGLERTEVRAELTSLYSRAEIRSIAQEIIQAQRDADAAMNMAGGPITAQEITAKANEIQNLRGKISFNPEQRVYEFESAERAFLTSSALPLDRYTRTVDTPLARNYLRNNVQQSLDPANNRRVNFRSRNVWNGQSFHF